jgi:dolichol kinase
LILAIFSLLHLKFKLKPLEKFAREQEMRFPLKGPIFFVVGSALVLLIFQKNVALASIAILTFGDSTSTLAGFIGTKYKINPFRKFKSVFGTFCGFVVAFIFALLFISPLLALIGSFFGMLSEAVSIKLGETDADDNLVVPLAAGTAMYFLSRVGVFL